MKKFWLLLLVAVFALVAKAQSIKSGSIDCLQGQTKVALVIDYSNATILGMSEGEYAKYEQNWELCKKETLVNFVTNFSDIGSLGEKVGEFITKGLKSKL